MSQNIDQINSDFYDSFGDEFYKIPFEEILLDWIRKYGPGGDALDIGCATGALATWLICEDYKVTCLEPARRPAAITAAKGIPVQAVSIQNFQTDQKFDVIFAMSSLIHVPQSELPAQIKKIASFLKPKGIFFISMIEGETEGLEDPTMKGKSRYFTRLSEAALDQLLAPYFDLLEKQRVNSKKMDRNFLLRVYAKR